MTYIAANPLVAFAIVATNLVILVCAGCLVALSLRSVRRVRRFSAMTFFAALGLQSLDVAAEFLFNPDGGSLDIAHGAWHLIALRTIVAASLVVMTGTIFLDSGQIDGLTPDPQPSRPYTGEDCEPSPRNTPPSA